MKIFFDPAKREATLRDRGLDFADAAEVFAGLTYDFVDDRIDYGEVRTVLVGVLHSRMVIVVYTDRPDGRTSSRCGRRIRVSKEDTETVWTDPDDAPELTDEWFDKADLRFGGVLIRKGGRPAGANKTHVSLRLDNDVLQRFRAGGPGWQTRINQALREAAERL